MPHHALGALLSVSVLVTASALAQPATPAPTVGDLRRVGAVHFPYGCDKSLENDFNSAVALLHSFFYEEARRRFTDVAKKDPSCAIAHWGIAMTLYHPIWAPPTSEELTQGAAAAEKAAQLAEKAGPLEKEFIAAIGAYYRPPTAPAATAHAQSCHGPTGGSGEYRARALAYAKEMEAIHKRHPNEVEAAAFYALALLGTAVPTDKALTNQTRAAKLLERHFAKRKNHPGLAHYLIHAYDYPSTAAKGLPAARLYADIAPWVPHVLHMPSHIFTRLGMWREVIASNLASADAARAYASANHPAAASFEELHALDYLVYGYLQTTQDEKAKELVEHVAKMKKTHPEVDMVVAYAVGAIPARYALERRDWEGAANLSIPINTSFAKFPFGEAHVEFARALGAARAKKPDLARKALERLEKLKASISDPRFEYFAQQLDMQRTLAEGFLAQAEGKAEDATRLVRQAADSDDLLGKHPVSPGSMYPARELLGDLLLEQGAAKQALAEYERSLSLNPGRFTGLYGAARAAELAGNKKAATKYYRQLIELAKPGAGTRPELAAANAYLTKSGT